MELYRLINLICLCVVNGFFTLAGIFLNSVVIISLWKSSQLRKKTCYFMILVLSCYDLGVVMFGHLTTILHSVVWSFNSTTSQISEVLDLIYGNLVGLAVGALLTMNIDRYLAITHPIFHKTSVTKDRLLKLMLFLHLLFVVVAILYSIPRFKNFGYMIIPFVIGMVLILIIFMNCRILRITSKKRWATHCTTRPTPMTKSNSSCLLVIACFFVCGAPLMLYNTFVAISGTSHKIPLVFWLWAATAAAMNSSLNCVIFAWRNTILYTEIKKTLTGIKTALR